MEDKLMHIPYYDKPSLQIKVTNEKVQPLLNYTNQSKFNKIPKVFFLNSTFSFIFFEKEGIILICKNLDLEHFFKNPEIRYSQQAK